MGRRPRLEGNAGPCDDRATTYCLGVIASVGWNPPVSVEAKQLTIEREKVFASMPPLDPAGVVRGQYDGYRDEEGVAADSDTETFVALRAFVDNWRWDGVPFYLRSGKRLAEDRHVLTVAFSQPPRRMFPLDCEQVAEPFGHDHF